MQRNANKLTTDLRKQQHWKNTNNINNNRLELAIGVSHNANRVLLVVVGDHSLDDKIYYQ